MLYTELVTALGGSRLEQATANYGDWSPNLVKSLIILNEGVLVEYHISVQGRTVVAVPGTVYDGTSKDPAQALNLKNFGALEELYVDPSTVKDFQKVVKFVTHQGNRIATVGLVQPAALDLGYLSQELSARRAVPDAGSVLLSEVFPELASVSQIVYSNPADYKSRYVLAPQVYRIDTSEGKLGSLLRGLDPRLSQSDTSSDELSKLIAWDNEHPAESNELYGFLSQVISEGESSLAYQLFVPVLLRFLPPWPITRLAPKASEGYSYLKGVRIPQGYSGGVESGACFDSQGNATRGIIAASPIYEVRRGYLAAVAEKFSDFDPQAWIDYPLGSELIEFVSGYSSEDDYEDESGVPDLDEGFESRLDDSGNTEAEVSEEPEELTDVDLLTQQVLSYYGGTIRGAVEVVLQEYDKIFASGYKVLKPFGILTESNGLGDVKFISENGHARSRVRSAGVPLRTMVELWALVQQRMGLTPVPNRNIGEIAEIVIYGHTKANPSLDYSRVGRLYFPYKMLEYAFGRKFNKGEVDTYPAHSAASTWEGYRSAEVERSLSELFGRIAVEKLRSLGLHFTDPEAANVISGTLQDVMQVFCTVVQVQDFDYTSDIPSRIKVRVLDPYGSIASQGNLAKDAVLATTGFPGTMPYSPSPIVDGTFCEFEYETNHQLATAEPLFAYKILESLLSQGKTPNAWDDRIIGMRSDGMPLTASELPLRQHLTHFTLAGSRSGKGVYTMGQTTGVFLGRGKPLGYLDNKPDIGSVIKHFNLNAFVINGADYARDTVAGFDYFGTLANIESEGFPNLPDYVAEAVGSTRWKSMLGNLVYVRSLLLLMGIIHARSKATPEVLDYLGGEDGVVIVVDELNNVIAPFSDWLRENVARRLAPSGYYTARRNYDAEPTTDAKGSVKPFKTEIDMPSVYDMWFTVYYEMMQESIAFTNKSRNAGIENLEAPRSDIFVLGQNPMYVLTSSDLTNEMFVERNKTSTGVKKAVKHLECLLPTLASPSSTDAFLGYNKNVSQCLAQGNTASKAYGKLDQYARNFGYVSQYNWDRAHKAWAGDLSIANNATYFKPALIFVDGSESAPFWQNAVNSIYDPIGITEQVRADNSEPSGELHRGIGFEGYLECAGVGPTERAEPLQRMVDIANYVVSKMGYPGSWYEFVKDFRPEWHFSIQNIVEAVIDGIPLTVERKALEEFRYLYPDAFDGAVAGVSGEVLDFDEDVWSSESEPGFGLSDFDYDTDSDTPSSDFSEVPLPPQQAPNLAGVNFQDPSQLAEAIGQLQAYQQQVSKPPYLVGTGFTDPSEGILPVTESWQTGLNPESLGIDSFEFDLVNDMERFVGGWSRLKTVQVIDQAVLFNGVMYRPELPDGPWQQNLPPFVVSAVESGNYARLLPWQVLRTLPITGLSFDSPTYVMDIVYAEMGWVSRPSVDRFFKSFPSLQTLHIGNRVFQRPTFKQYPDRNDIFYTAEVAKSFSALAVNSMSQGSKSLWGWTTNSVRRSDLSGWGKTWRGAVGVVGTGTVGAAALTAKGSQRVLGKIRQGFGTLRDNLAEARTLGY